MSPRLSENFDIGMRLSLQGIGAVLRSDNEFTETRARCRAARRSAAANSMAVTASSVSHRGDAGDGGRDRLASAGCGRPDPQTCDSTVRLDILPKSQGVRWPYHEVTLVRDEIKLEDKAAKSEVIEVGGGLRLGVIEIPAFYRDFGAQAAGDDDFRSTTRDVRKLLEKLQSERVDGIIVDLRRNGRRSLSEATELTACSSRRGRWCRSRTRRARSKSSVILIRSRSMPASGGAGRSQQRLGLGDIRRCDPGLQPRPDHR